MTGIHGEYNSNGYTVYCGCTQIYSAGNSLYDSQVCGCPKHELRTLRSFCIQTSKEYAFEQKRPYLGVQRVEEI
jgi:hypothetical protein